MATQLIGLLVAASTLLAAAGTDSSPPAVTTANSTTATRTAYGMMVRKGFPVGILPQGVQHYKLTPSGSFQVELADNCMFDVAGKYTFYYRRHIAGRIRYRSMSGLNGMVLKAAESVIEASEWRSVERVDRDREYLSFHVSGRITQKITVLHFLVSPRCL